MNQKNFSPEVGRFRKYSYIESRKIGKKEKLEKRNLVGSGNFRIFSSKKKLKSLEK